MIHLLIHTHTLTYLTHTSHVHILQSHRLRRRTQTQTRENAVPGHPAWKPDRHRPLPLPFCLMWKRRCVCVCVCVYTASQRASERERERVEGAIYRGMDRCIDAQKRVSEERERARSHPIITHCAYMRHVFRIALIFRPYPSKIDSGPCFFSAQAAATVRGSGVKGSNRQEWRLRTCGNTARRH